MRWNPEIGQRSGKMKRWILAAAWLLFLPHAFASCLDDAAKAYNLDPLLIKSIRWVESRDNPNAVGPRLRDGNVALGAMQINTIHLPELKSYGVTRDLLFDECTNLKIGAWALSKCISKFGPTGKAVGCYNTGPASENIDAQERYALKVGDAYSQLKLNPNRRPNSKLRQAIASRNEAEAAAPTRIANLKELRSWEPVNEN